MSEGRGLTLRKKRSKRPQISGPTPAPSGPGVNVGVSQRDRVQQSETADLVKRRYSTRYNQLPQFGLDVPDVPALPGQLKRRSNGASPNRPSTAHSQHPLKVDQAALMDANLQHERYITDLLSNASESDIQEYQNNLRRVKNRTSLDIQHSVYQNRNAFIRISKEAERLQNEMNVLRGLMTELTTALGQSTSNSTSGLDRGASVRRANRSSVANLESMWNTQLQVLWKHVERSQKFLPAAPGRHIVTETGSWIELDSATWKPKRPVHIVLLNDHLLVASKKRKKPDPNNPNQGPGPTKLVAEECWPLGDIDIVDMAANVAGGPSTPAEQRAISTAITVRSSNRSLIYRHENKDNVKAKTELLLALRKAVEELRKANMPVQEKLNTKNDAVSFYAARDPATANDPEIMGTLSHARGKPDILIEVEGKQQNFRWVEGQIDELDIDIALQRFEEAVDRVEKLRLIVKGLKSNSVAQDLITLQLDERAAKLAGTLCRDLVDTPSFTEATKRTTSFLIRLDFEDKARELYLAARGDTLSKRARQCIFDGDLHRYVFSISYVYFTIIRNTVNIFQACFAPATMSACIKWANEHLETFNALLVRQLSSVEKGGNVWHECMDVVWNHEKEMLNEVGLDFREVIGRGLEDHSRSRSINDGQKRPQSRSKSRSRMAK